MQNLDFGEAVKTLIKKGSPYHEDAYYFLREALDHAVKARMRQVGEQGHVTGAQICESARQLALKLYGPMVLTVFEYWNIHSTADFGEMVWALIEIGVFGKSDRDQKADFDAVYDFKEAFVHPFLPHTPAEKRTRRTVAKK